MEVDPRWYERFFDDDWLRVALAAPDEVADKAVAFLDDQLGIERGARILDLACGHGRHAIRLAKLGYRVTGVDLSEKSLELAHRSAAEAGVDVDFRHGDMRAIDFDAEFDAVLNLFTSFGYFEDEGDDRRVLERVERALKPGGVFVIDLISLLAIARSFQPRHWDDLADGWTMLDEREYDAWSGRSSAVWTLLGPGGERRELRHSVRLYTLPELRAMLTAAGLEPERAWLNWDGDDYVLSDRGRMIVKARKTFSAA